MAFLPLVPRPVGTRRWSGTWNNASVESRKAAAWRQSDRLKPAKEVPAKQRTSSSRTPPRSSLTQRLRALANVPERKDNGSLLDAEQEALESMFSFSLDEFQLRAIRSVLQSRSVVVSVPTGSGKTVIGEAALAIALKKGMRAFYTTPLKALSNQKFGDFCDRFGTEQVGLLTGDISIRPDAPILVMTTEVYRNMLYRCRTGVLAELSVAASPVDEVLAPATEDAHSIAPLLRAGYLDDLFVVVFDEFHYMNDRERGTVWEEAVIGSPTHTILVALSATMRNAAEISEWFEAVHGVTDLIVANDRPVPLEYVYLDADGLHPLLVPLKRSSGDKGKGFGRSRQRGARNESKFPTIEGRYQMNPELVWNVGQESKQIAERRQRWRDANDPNLRRSAEVLERREARRLRELYRVSVPSYPFLVRCLRNRQLLPAIVFVFSRSGCDRAVSEVLRERSALKLVSKAERAMLESEMEAFFEVHPELRENPDSQKRYESIMEGVAAHHAGMLPLWKALVEQLFQANLIKVVFATETLAAGINMPARSTVVTALSKRSRSEGIQRLTPNEFLQMAGRAGRRGMDPIGYVVVMQSAWEPSAEVACQLLQRGADALRSNFVPSYGMALNLLRYPGTPLQSARRYLERSFGSFLASRGRLNQWKPEIHDEVEALERQVKEAHRIFAQHGGEKVVAAYDKLLERLRCEERILGYLHEQHEESAVSIMEDLLVFSDPGTIVLLPDRAERAVLAGVVVERTLDTPLRFALVAADGRIRVCGPRYIAAVLSKEPLAKFSLPDSLTGLKAEALSVLHWRELFSASSRYGEVRETFEPVMDCGLVDVGTAPALEYSEMTTWDDLAAPPLAVPEIRRQQKLVVDLQERLASFSLHDHPDCELVLKAYRSLGVAEAHLGRLRQRLMRQTMQATATESWNIFRALVDVLERYRCLERVEEVEDDARAESGQDVTRAEPEASDDTGSRYTFFRLTEFGSIVAGLRVENELWAGLALIHAEQQLAGLAPHELAAVVASIAADTSLPPGGYCRFLPSVRVLDLCREVLGPLRKQLAAAQQEALETYWSPSMATLNGELMIPDVRLSYDLAGVVEAWACETPWSTLLNGVSLDEGDIVRLLRRTIDLLRQIANLGTSSGLGWSRRVAALVSSQLVMNAKRALTLIDRYPVNDSGLERASGGQVAESLELDNDSDEDSAEVEEDVAWDSDEDAILATSDE